MSPARAGSPRERDSATLHIILEFQASLASGKRDARNNDELLVPGARGGADVNRAWTEFCGHGYWWSQATHVTIKFVSDIERTRLHELRSVRSADYRVDEWRRSPGVSHERGRSEW